MDKISKNLQRLENSAIALCFIVMSLAAFAQVANRNLVGASISWFDELARYCMVYLTLLATEAGLRDGSQIAITALQDRCPPAIKRLLQIVIKLIVIAFALMILDTSIDLINMQIRSGQTSASLGVPMWIPYMALPISFAIISIVQIISLILLFKAPLTASTTNANADSANIDSADATTAGTKLNAASDHVASHAGQKENK